MPILDGIVNDSLHFDVFFDDIYTENNKQYIDIENVGTVELSVEDNQTEVLIKNIYFKNI